MPNLTLAGHEYDAELLKRLAGSAPRIQVDLSDINDDSNPEHKPILSEPFEASNVVFYKQHGKMTVLLGDVEKNTKNGKVSGSLLSSPVIKKARLSETVNFQQPGPRFSEEFSNRPRFHTPQNRHAHR